MLELYIVTLPLHWRMVGLFITVFPCSSNKIQANTPAFKSFKNHF